MKKKILWSLLILVSVLTFVWPMVPLTDAAARISHIPDFGPDFRSQSLDISKEDQNFLGEAKAIQKLITMRNGGRFVLTVIDGTKNRHAVHDPSYCLSGAGWKITGKNSVSLMSGKGSWVSLVKDDQKTEALWFFDDGVRQFNSTFEYWWKSSSRRATLGRSGAEPVLVTIRSLPNETPNWERIRQIILPSLGFH